MNSPALPTNPAPGRPKDMEKRTAVLEAAMALFPSRGYDGVSMDAIAQAAGVSKLTVYSHFADKEALFAAAVTECCAQLLPHRLFVPDPGLPVAEALFQIARPFVDLMMDDRAVSLHRVMISQAGQDQRLTEVFFGAGPRAILLEMESFLHEAGQSGYLRVADPARAFPRHLQPVRPQVRPSVPAFPTVRHPWRLRRPMTGSFRPVAAACGHWGTANARLRLRPCPGHPRRS